MLATDMYMQFPLPLSLAFAGTSLMLSGHIA